MAGLVPAIHVLLFFIKKGVDARHKAGHDSGESAVASKVRTGLGNMAQESLRIGKSELTDFVTSIFMAVGLTKEHAAEWAKMLVWANLRGTDSHGIIRIPRYIDLVNAKSINPAPNIRIEKKEGAAVVLEGDAGEPLTEREIGQEDRILGRRDQELGGHAADPGAGGAVLAALDRHRPGPQRLGGAVGGHAGSAGADDRDDVDRLPDRPVDPLTEDGLEDRTHPRRQVALVDEVGEAQARQREDRPRVEREVIQREVHRIPGRLRASGVDVGAGARRGRLCRSHPMNETEESTMVVQAYILIQTEVGRAALAAATIAEIAGVASSEEVSGPYDVIVRVDASDATHLTENVVPQIQKVDGITRTLTCPVVHI